MLAILILEVSAADTNLWPAVMNIDGRTYSNVVFLSRTPATITIRHATGIATIPLEQLHPRLQIQFHFDPAAAASYRIQQAVVDNVYFKQQAALKAARDNPDRLGQSRNSLLSDLVRAYN